MSTILDWPENERPREKLLSRGSDALSDAELLAIFLRTGIRGRSAVDLARDLLREHGSLRALAAADVDAFCASPGLGPAKWAQLQACLEMARRVLAAEELSQGTLDAASVYPREVVKRALALRAAAVIFAHNHPSGVSEPSSADRLLTERLKQALALVDVRVLDHFVVGEGLPTSFAERGWL